MTTQAQYNEILPRIKAIIGDETDPISIMATIACELYHGLPDFHWVGFYRRVAKDLLKVGPYQGTHGCLEISFDRGVCGKCAREIETQIVEDVSALPYHIACSSTTRSEIVLPITNAEGELIAVLDVDSNLPAAFTQLDADNLATLNTHFTR